MKEKKTDELIDISLSSDDKDIRWHSTRALAIIGNIKAVGPLISILNDPDGPQGRAAWALGQIGSETSIPSLVEALEKYEGRMQIISHVIGAIDRIHSTSAVEPLLKMMKDDKTNFHSKLAAVGLLGKLGDGRALRPLINLLKQDHPKENTSLLAGAIFSLEDLGNPEAIPHLITALKKVDEIHREGLLSDAIISFENIAVEPLLRALKREKDIAIRDVIVNILGNIDDERSKEIIRKELKKRSKRILSKKFKTKQKKGREKGPSVTEMKRALEKKGYEVLKKEKKTIEDLMQDSYDGEW